MPGKWPDQALNAIWTAWNVGSWQDLQFWACGQSRKSLTFTSVRDFIWGVPAKSL